MACAGVVASAGAQLDFVFVTVGTAQYTTQSGKSTITITESGFSNFGTNDNGSVSYPSEASLSIGNGQKHTINRLEDTGLSSIFLQFVNPKVGGSTGDNAPSDGQGAGSADDINLFRQLVIHNPHNGVFKLPRVNNTTTNVSNASTSIQWFTGYNAGMFKTNTSNGDIVIVELRGDL